MDVESGQVDGILSQVLYGTQPRVTQARTSKLQLPRFKS